MTTSKKWVLAAFGLAAALGAGSAMARSDVQWSVTIGAPVYQAYPAYPAYPVYGPPVYAHPAPVIVRPAYPVHAAPVYYPRHRAQPAYPRHWDRDGDGIPNRYDRVYNPRWDRDGDGIPNRHDRYDDRYDDRRWGR